MHALLLLSYEILIHKITSYIGGGLVVTLYRWRTIAIPKLRPNLPRRLVVTTLRRRPPGHGDYRDDNESGEEAKLGQQICPPGRRVGSFGNSFSGFGWIFFGSCSNYLGMSIIGNYIVFKILQQSL